MPRYTLCPFYKFNTKTRISCEDCVRWFDTPYDVREWMAMYCDDDWEHCPYAAELNAAYKALKGDKKALENHELKALRREYKNVCMKLGSAEKQLERSHDLRRKAEEDLAHYEKTVGDQLKRIALIYEQRLAYMIDRYAPDGRISESEIQAWAGEKEFALVSERKGKDIVWKVVFKTDEESKPDNTEENK